MNRKPRNEKEALLRAIALGESVDGIKPNAYENYWLREIAKSGGSGGGIKDVTELPNTYGWKGTPVDINTRRVYFNTALSGDEVNKIIDEFIAKINDNNYFVIANDDVEHSLQVMNTSLRPYQILDGLQLDEYFKNGEWVINNGYIDINWEIVTVGEHNDLLSMLISSTPFEKVGELNDKAIYRLEEQDTSKLVEVKGQPIPCDDKTYIGSVRINPNLTDEQMVEILDSLGLTNDMFYYICNVGIDALYVRKKDNGTYEISSDNGYMLADNNHFGNDLIEFNSTSLSTYEGEPIDSQNDKLKDLFYYTTYGTKSDLYTYDGEWCKLVKERPLKVIDVSKADTYEDADGSIIYDLIENGEYFLLTNGIDKIKLNFGKCKDNKAYGKFLLLTDSLRDVDYKDGYTSGSYDIDSSFTILENNFSFYIKVTDNLVYITVEDAV